MSTGPGAWSRQCAWCGRDPGDAALQTGRRVRSGICASCLAGVAAGTRVPVTELVASRAGLAFLVDADHTIGMVNRRALDLLGKRADQVLGERTGTALECENAYLAGGCGLTIRCSGCTLRQSIAHTYLTGQPRFNIRGTVTVARGAGVEDVRMTFSTARIEDRILLEIGDFRA